MTWDASDSLARAGNIVEYLCYGFSRPLNVLRWEIRAAYYGSPIEGFVRNERADLRVTHGQVLARFYREPDHVPVGQAPTEIGNVRPGTERLFLIQTALRVAVRLDRSPHRGLHRAALSPRGPRA